MAEVSQPDEVTVTVREYEFSAGETSATARLGAGWRVELHRGKRRILAVQLPITEDPVLFITEFVSELGAAEIDLETARTPWEAACDHYEGRLEQIRLKFGAK